MIGSNWLGLLGLIRLISAQGLDLDLLAELNQLPTATIPVVYILSQGATAATAVTSTYSQSAMLASISSVLNDPFESNTAVIQVSASELPSGSRLDKRAPAVSTCLAQPTGYGPIPSPDNASMFVSFAAFAAVASSAPIPSGYTNVFTNRQGSNNALGYLGFTTLKQYDPSACAKKCSSIAACQSFNLYFERNPSRNPDDPSCSDPPSTTQIKCVFWGSQITAENAKNTGQWRNKFRITIAGSNGYTNTTVTPPRGFQLNDDLDNSAIVDPLDCNSYTTYLKHVMLTGGGPFDPSLCAVACSAQTSDAGNDTTGHCRFFNTFLVHKNGNPLGQDCYMYNQSWTSSEASNEGKTVGTDTYTIGSSYTFSSIGDVSANCVKINGVPSSSSFSLSSSSFTPISISSSTTSSISSTTLTTTTSFISSSSSTSTTSSVSSSSSTITSTSTGNSFDLQPTSLSTATYDSTSTTPATTITAGVLVPESTGVGDIAPKDTHPMDFARDSTPGSAPMMRATLYAREDSPLVNMEAFISYIASAQCLPSQIQLTFKSQKATDVAKEWPQNFQLMTSNAAFCPGTAETARSFYSVSSVTFTGNTVTLAVTESDISKSTTRLVTKFDTKDVDGTDSGTSSKAKKQKRYGKDGDTWFHISIGSFPQWLRDFVGGYHAGYNAVVAMEPIDPSQIGKGGFNSVIQCNNCGVEADIDLYGGFDMEWYGALNYAKVGFRVRNAIWNNLFSINVANGYNKRVHAVLASLDLPGLNFGGVLDINPIVKLSTDVSLSVQGGTMNVDGFGLRYQQGSQDMLVEWDIKNHRSTSSGWQHLEPRINPPLIDNIPSNVEFMGAIGPEFGVGVSIMKLLAGFQVPAIRVAVSSKYSIRNIPVLRLIWIPPDHNGETSNCNRASKYPSNAVDYPVDIRASAGIGVYADFGVSAGSQAYDRQDLIFSDYWDAGSMCMMLAGSQVSNPDAGVNCYYCAF
ncbi:hypothetical protein E4T47_03005 [Aureobasidium subglaciale]|nr:hypothetical protein E4T47_03005 [Aureobasidium subglaciale]